MKKKGIYFRIMGGFLALWCVFFLVFSGLTIRARRDRIIWEVNGSLSTTAQITQQAVMKYSGLQYGDYSVMAVDPAWDMKGELQRYIGLNRTLRGLSMSLAVYDGTPAPLAKTGAYLTVRYCLPNRFMEGYGEDQFVHMGESHEAVLDIYEALPEQAASKLISYCQSASWGSEDILEVGSWYCVNFPWFWTDGETVIPKYILVYDGREEEEIQLPSITQDGKWLSEGRCGQVWFYENTPEPQQIEGMTLLGNGDVPMLTGMAQEPAWAAELVGDEEQVWALLSEDSGAEQQTQNLFLASSGFFRMKYWGCYVNPQVQTADGLYPGTWIFFAGEGSPLGDCAKGLLAVGLGSLLMVGLVGYILAAGLQRIYETQAQLEESRRKTTNAMAHDLKTPMAALMGYAENLLEHTRPDKEEQYLRGICTQVERMNGTVGQMLELSRLEAAVEPLNRERFSLGELCCQTAEEMSGSIRILVSGDEMIWADRAMLRRVLENFLSNAIRYTTPGGTVRVEIRQRKCTVKNPGQPIPTEELERIWEAHYQRNPARSEGGSGLGLSIAREILHRHGFSWGVQNGPEGPEFWFSF